MQELESPLNTPNSIPVKWRMPNRCGKCYPTSQGKQLDLKLLESRALYSTSGTFCKYCAKLQLNRSSSVQSLTSASSGPPTELMTQLLFHSLVTPPQIFETRLMKCSLLKTVCFFDYVKKSTVELDSAGSVSSEELLC